MIQYYTKKDAISEVRKMRKTGWPKARIQKCDDVNYIITTHHRGCKCGSCPVVRVSGFVS